MEKIGTFAEGRRAEESRLGRIREKKEHEKAKELWETACGCIQEWQKITKRNFIEEFELVMRGD